MFRVTVYATLGLAPASSKLIGSCCVARRKVCEFDGSDAIWIICGRGLLERAGRRWVLGVCVCGGGGGWLYVSAGINLHQCIYVYILVEIGLS